MTNRLLVGLGIAAAITAAVSALAPAALAQDLAEGVSCGDHSCRNDTDDIYRIEVRVHCSDFGGTYEKSIWVNSHSTEDVQASCGHWKHGMTHPGTSTVNPDGSWSHTPTTTDPDTYESGMVMGIDYLNATVDNSSRRRPGAPAPSGSCFRTKHPDPHRDRPCRWTITRVDGRGDRARPLDSRTVVRSR